MATESRRVVHTQLRGDWLSTGGRAAQEQFSGHNVHVYENGSLGERPGWDKVTWTSPPTGTHPLRGIAWYKGTSADGELFTVVHDSTLLRVSRWTVVSGAMGAAAATDTLTKSVNPDPPSVWDQSWPGQKLYPMFSDTSSVLGVASELYKTFPGTSYVASLGGGQASASLIYRERAFYWGFNNFPGRIYYSAAGDYTTSDGFFDVTPFPDIAGQGIIGLWNVRDALLIARRDGVWLAMFGTNPNDGSLREIGHGTIPRHGISVADMDNQLWFSRPDGGGVVKVTPSAVEAEELDMARPGRQAGTETGMPIGGPYDQQALRGIADVHGRNIMFPYLPSSVVGAHDTVWFLCRINGLWVQESFTHTAPIQEVDFVMMGENTVAMVIRDSTPSYHLYTRRLTSSRPSRTTGDAFVSQISTETSPNVSLLYPEIISPPGAQMRVRQVLVDLDYWKQNAEFDTPAITVGVRQFGADVATGSEEVLLSTVTISGSGWANTAGTAVPSRRREAATFADSAYAASNQVQISGLASVAIQQITVVLDEQSTPRS